MNYHFDVSNVILEQSEGYDQWLEELDNQIDVDQMLEELWEQEVETMERFYDYTHKRILDVTQDAVTEYTLQGTETYPIPVHMGAIAQQWIDDYRRWYPTKRKPGRRPNWLVTLEDGDGMTELLPNEQIIVEFAD